MNHFGLCYSEPQTIHYSFSIKIGHHSVYPDFTNISSVPLFSFIRLCNYVGYKLLIKLMKLSYRHTLVCLSLEERASSVILGRKGSR